MSIKAFKDIKEQLSNSNLFDKINEKVVLYKVFDKRVTKLSGTDFYYNPYNSTWLKYIAMSSNLSQLSFPFCYEVSFEQVLDSIGSELQIELLFHLDLFR